MSRRKVMGETVAQDAYTIPSPWPVAPGMPAVRVVPPQERDAIERLPMMRGYDANAVQGQDLIDQYFDRSRLLEQERI